MPARRTDAKLFNTFSTASTQLGSTLHVPVSKKTQPSKSGFSGHFKTFKQQVETKVSKGAQRMFDLVASNPRILPPAEAIVNREMRVSGCGEVCVPPGGARLVTFHYQRFGCPAHNLQWSDSQGRIEIGYCYCCTAKHP